MNELRLIVRAEPDVEAERLHETALELLADALAERAINAARERRQAGLSTPPATSARLPRGRRA